jgi:hypothetical protein
VVAALVIGGLLFLGMAATAGYAVRVLPPGARVPLNAGVPEYSVWLPKLAGLTAWLGAGAAAFAALAAPPTPPGPAPGRRPPAPDTAGALRVVRARAGPAVKLGPARRGGAPVAQARIMVTFFVLVIPSRNSSLKLPISFPKLTRCGAEVLRDARDSCGRR